MGANKADQTEIVQATKTITTGRGGKNNFPFSQEPAEPGTNSRYLRFARAALSLPPIDISDPAQVENRINAYFDYCEDNDRKPNIIGMANWLGVSRDTIATWKTGEYRGDTHSAIIKKAISALEEMWVDYMMDGKVNPGSGIFIGKNHFQYRDEQNITITPNQQITDISAEDVAAKYQELPE